MNCRLSDKAIGLHRLQHVFIVKQYTRITAIGEFKRVGDSSHDPFHLEIRVVRLRKITTAL